jgi:hypothetical protein
MNGPQFLDPISLIGDDSEALPRAPAPMAGPPRAPVAWCCCTRASDGTVGELAFFASSRVQVALAVGKRAVRESMCVAMSYVRRTMKLG